MLTDVAAADIMLRLVLVLLLLFLLLPCVHMHLQFVLLVGCMGLAVYTATQVFGWTGLVLGQSGSSYGGSNVLEHAGWYAKTSCLLFPSAYCCSWALTARVAQLFVRTTVGRGPAAVSSASSGSTRTHAWQPLPAPSRRGHCVLHSGTQCHWLAGTVLMKPLILHTCTD
jgi:hypothetical protein